MRKPSFYDERVAGTAAKIAAIVLPLTQLALLLAVLYRAYVLNQPDSEFNDLRIILALSVFGYIGASLFWGGFFPMLKVRTLLVIYLALVVGLFAVLSLVYGLPTVDNWTNTLLPVLLGPAIMVGLYAGLAYWGQKRLEKEISSSDVTETEI
jgi:hypothetical protein